MRLIFALALTLQLPAADTQQIRAFWSNTLQKLAAEPIDAKEHDMREPLPYKSYRVEFRSLGGVRVRAHLSMPIRGGEPARPLPAIVSVPGYGGFQQALMLSECQRGYAILQVFPRSQGHSAELWKIDGPDKLTWHLDQPEGYYYQLAYADILRGVDYLLTRKDIDPQRIAIAGTSQGGGIALAVASLDPRLKAVAAHVPFLCDMRLAARTDASLIKQLLDKASVNDEAHLRTLDFFDPLNLVSTLHAPTIISAGGKDLTCPAVTIRNVFDRIPAVKSLFHDPDLPHTTSAPFYQLMWLWLERYLKP
ncbi:MAG: acetylxylan esterase [Bryobacterales bacterium]|nr:acetylxylan esterase [Bryobacterales bacterium]